MSIENLTAPERETVVTTDDGTDVVRIWTAQRKVINRLTKNSAFTLIKSGAHGSSPWAEFTIPADQWSPSSGAKRRSKPLSAEQRAALAARLARANPPRVTEGT